MNRAQAVLACCALLAPVARGADDADPIGAKLAKAISLHKEGVEKTEKAVLEALDKRAEASMKDLKGAEKLDAEKRFDRERTEFRENKKFPSSLGIPARQDYDGAVRDARKQLEKAYTDAINEYTGAGQKDRAREVRAEKEDFFKKPGPGGAKSEEVKKPREGELKVENKPAKAPAGPDPVGRPEKFEQGKATRFAVWHEDGWWVIQTTTDNQGGNKAIDPRHVFSGKVRVPRGKIIKYGDEDTLDFKGKPADLDVLTKKSNGFDFTFVNFGFIDGIKFKLDDAAKEVEFEIKIDGTGDPRKIIIGSKGVNPEKATFTLAVPAKEKK